MRKYWLGACLAACMMLLGGGAVVANGAPNSQAAGEQGGPREGQCEDGIDNDEDGFTDEDDLACQQPGCLPSSQTPKKCDEETLSPENPEAGNCEDGIDNDGDGLTDDEDPDCQAPCDDADEDGVCDDDDACPDDAGTLENGCSPEGPAGDPTCSDGIDNDGDGLFDGNDPDCQAPCDDADEDGVCDDDDACPDDAGTLENGCSPEGPAGDPTCSDGIDNDGDGLFDGDDPDCQGVGPLNLCTGAAMDRGLLTEDTLGQLLWDSGLSALSPLTEDPERNGAISGPLGEALTGTALEVVGDELSCAIDLLLDENTFPDL